MTTAINPGTKSSHHGQEISRCRRCGSRLCRLCRFSWWRRGLALLCVATVLSALLPGAPLARWLLSEDTERHRLLAEKELRTQRSQLFMEQYRARHGRQGNSGMWDRTPAAEVGVAVLTMSRERQLSTKKSYRTESLIESVAALLELLNDTSLHRTYTFLLCNVDEKPELFLEAKALEDVLPVFKRFQPTKGNVSVSSSRTTWEKLKMDYIYCLQQTLARGVRYVLLVEDDAVAHKDLFPVLEHVLKTVIEAPGARPLAYIKLYHPLRLLGYISLEVERLPELLALSLILGAFLTCWTRGLRNVLQYDFATTMSCRDVWTKWAGWTVVVAVVALAIGRTNLLELRRLSHHLYQVTPTPSCCTPAILYTRQGAQDLSSFLLNVTCTAKRSTDMRMDEFRKARAEWRGLLVQPNLFSHIGLVSGLHGEEVSPLIVQ